jgi:hypothetical protein
MGLKIQGKRCRLPCKRVILRTAYAAQPLRLQEEESFSVHNRLPRGEVLPSMRAEAPPLFRGPGLTIPADTR